MKKTLAILMLFIFSFILSSCTYDKTDLPANDDIEKYLATQISNTTRVYKGGSWKDRSYWLNPATRRYKEQTQSSNDIGFRCAMDRVGSDKGNNSK